MQGTSQAEEWAAGAWVDLWDNGGWWETRVLEQDANGKYVLEAVSDASVSHDRLRRTVTWDGHAFSSGRGYHHMLPCSVTACLPACLPKMQQRQH